MSTWRPLKGRDEREPRRLAGSLDRYVRRLGAPSTPSLTAVFGAWESIVGSQVAAHARPLSLVRGTLVVGVDDSAWATQLRYLGADVARRIAEVAGPDVVREIEVRVQRPNRRS